MAMKRADLKGLGLEDDVIDKIIAMHADTVNGIRSDSQREQGEAATAVSDLQRQLGEMRTQMAQAKDSYDTLKRDFDAYRQSAKQQETNRAKTAAYRDLLQAIGIKGDNRLDAILRTVQPETLELSEDGTLKDREALEKAAKEEWAEFITTTERHGADTKTPPDSAVKAYTADDIRKMTPAEINANFDAIKASLKGETS